MFHHPAWAVGCYSSGPPAGGTPQIQVNKPSPRGHGTPCTHLIYTTMAQKSHNLHLKVWLIFTHMEVVGEHDIAGGHLDAHPQRHPPLVIGESHSREVTLSLGIDILFLKHDCSIFRQSSNPVCAVWPTENWLASSMNHIQDWKTV